jgi:hypothetical protein
MRGRNNGGGNNRKGPNPLNRNYESNGPDVKIRGSAQQIAEKYAALARDAMSSGDRVMAENYLQHAEHYNRIIAAAQAQMPIQHVQHRNDDFDDDLDEDRDDFENGAGEAQLPVVNHGAGPQPVIEGTPAEVALNADGNRDPNRGNNGNGGRHRDRDRRNGGSEDFHGRNGQRSEYASRAEQNKTDDAAEAEREPSVGNRTEAEDRPQAENLSPAGLAAQIERNESGEEDAAPRRTRRPRRPRAKADPAGNASAEAAPAEAGDAESAPAPGEG